MDPQPVRVSNPINPFSRHYVEWCDETPEADFEVFEERASSILTENDSPDISFRYSVNPYRGCFHACAYCYARPSHNYLGFGAGTDFERKIVAKVNAQHLLRQALMRRTWRKELILFSGNTDCYQPLEMSYELTRRCIETCHDFRNPIAVITKGAVIRRDIDLLSQMSKRTSVSVVMSIAFSDDRLSKQIEPHAPRPSHRFKTMKLLRDAGVQVSLALAPVIPGLNDSQIPSIVEQAAGNGAESAFMTLLRLPGPVKEVFAERLDIATPTRAAKVLAQLKDMKGGQLNRSDFGKRMVGEGARWEAIRWSFEQSCEKFGLRNGEKHDRTSMEVRPQEPRQLGLFAGSST